MAVHSPQVVAQALRHAATCVLHALHSRGLSSFSPEPLQELSHAVASERQRSAQRAVHCVHDADALHAASPAPESSALVDASSPAPPSLPELDPAAALAPPSSPRFARTVLVSSPTTSEQPLAATAATANANANLLITIEVPIRSPMPSPSSSSPLSTDS